MNALTLILLVLGAGLALLIFNHDAGQTFGIANDDFGQIIYLLPIAGLLSVGILSGPTVVDSIAAAPRWQVVTFPVTALRRLGPDVAVLAYRVEATRPAGAAHAAFCSSTYVQQAGEWWLMQHQQTPT